jgi:hypothetical protein
MEEEKNYIPTITIIVLVVIIVAFGAYYFGQNSNNNQPQDNQGAVSITNQSSPQTETQPVIQSEAPKPVVQTPPKQKSLSDIVNEWKPRIGYLSCRWTTKDSSGNIIPNFSKQGSGTVIRSKDGTTIGILTNRHVVDDGNGNIPNNGCDFITPDNNLTFLWRDNSSIQYASNGSDGAFIVMATNDPSRIINYSYFNNVAIKNKWCDTYYPNGASLGDDVAILGYPSIGASEMNIKVTKGIISEVDNDYFLTDAKIEEGNSGGTAILLKDDCFLGIPTFKTYPGPTGEYLAGILKSEAIFK